MSSMAEPVAIRALRPEELDDWLDFVHRVFGVAREYFARHWGCDPWRNLESIRVAVHGGRIVATLRIFHRTIYLGGVPVSIGGIGEVSTDPDYRRQGLSGLLLEDACRRMAELGMAVSVLFAGRQGHYTRHGWAPVPIPFGVTELKVRTDLLGNLTSATFDGLAVNPVSPADAPDLAALYGACASGLNGTLVRDHPGYWWDWLPAEWPEVWVARAGDRPVGYLAGKWLSLWDLRVEEFVAAPSEAGALLKAITAGILRGRREGGGPLHVHYPLAAAPALALTRRYNVDGPMYKVIRPDLLPPAAAGALDELLGGEVDRHVIWQADWF
ncbi:MAG TPA: GNAT family N-acetyltransferase [Symbiobacteriaceae bacterium]|jgi:predicted N-acetyltransferase YhbS